MPHLSLNISAGGPIVEFFVGASVPRAEALKKAGQPVPNPILVRGLIDTGASCTSVDCTVLKQLRLVSTGSVPIHTPSTSSGTPHTVNQFDVSLILQHPKLAWQFHAVPVIETNLAHQGILALVGRDILSNCLLCYDGQAGIFSLAF
jgi:hypothetical protein